MNLKVIRDLLITLAMILFFALVIVTLNSCVPEVPENVKKIDVTHETLYFHDDEWNDYSIRDVYRFEYNGHKYIQFGCCDYQTIVHDPDCPCQKKKTTSSSIFDEW